jgi:filamentous hemagglutinin
MGNGLTDEQRVALADQARELRAEAQGLSEIWGVGSTGRMIVTALTAAAGGNVTGTGVEFLQSAAVNYLQSLGAQQVKLIADELKSDEARAALHALLACAGAAAQSQDCGTAAAGAAASVVINNLIKNIDGKDPMGLDAAEKEARINLVASLIAGITEAAGGDAAVAATAARIEMENNHLGTGISLFGRQIGRNQIEEFATEMQETCNGSDLASCREVYDKWKELAYKQGGLRTEGQRSGWEDFVLSVYEEFVFPLCKGNQSCIDYVNISMAMDVVIHAGDGSGLRDSIRHGRIVENIANGNWVQLTLQGAADLAGIAQIGGTLGSVSRVGATGAAQGAKGAAKGGIGVKGAVSEANFAQSSINAAGTFSAEGAAKYSQLAGVPIRTVDDLAAAINKGLISPSQLPVDYVVMSNGSQLILNTRTSTALGRAGIPQSQWYGVNQTGVQVPGMSAGTTFNDLAAGQLARNKLPPTGTPNIPGVKK